MELEKYTNVHLHNDFELASKMIVSRGLQFKGKEKNMAPINFVGQFS